MYWIIKNIITNKKLDKVIYGLSIAIIILDFLTDEYGNPDNNLIGFNILLIVLIIVVIKEILNFLYRRLYFTNQSNLNSMRELVKKRDYNQAIILYDKIQIIKSQLTEKKYWRGVAYLYLDESHKSLIDFNAVETEYLNFSGFYYYKGLALIDLDENEKAIEYLTRSIELEKTWLNLDQRGIAFLNINELESAEKDLRNSLAIKVESSNSCNLAIILEKKGLYKEAMKYFDISIDNNDKDGNAYFNRGFSKCEHDDVENGLVDLKKAYELGHLNANEMISKYKTK